MSDSVENKITAIKAEIERKNKEASGLLQYLSIQQQLAKDEEQREEEELKRQGIIVGQHIPSLPSRLDLDHHAIDQFEYASTLLIGRDLVQQNRTSFLRKTGNLPISELAEARRDANLLTLAAQDPDIPHYLNQTHTAQLREERISVRFADTLQTSPKQKRKTATVNDSATLFSVSATEKKKADKERERNRPISMKEKLEHENVLNSINHKLNYLRNPRNDPKAVGKMLVKTKLQATNIPVANNDPEGQQESSTSNSNKFSLKAKPLDTNPLFVCEPSMILFNEYDIGKKYTRSIAFRNVSAVSRTVRVLPPNRSGAAAFSLAPLRYPPNCPNGVIAPGMSVSTTLTFAPLALGDYHDCIKVETESGSCVVTIIAQREPPNLSIPSAINLGACLVGDAMRCSLQCSNTGGMGRFELLETVNDDASSAVGASSLRLPPFTVYPTSFDLKKNESVDLIFEFVPTVLGLSKRSFIVRCDNGQIREFFVAATAKEVHVSYAEVNGSSFTPHNPSISHGSSNNQQGVVEGEVFQDLDFKAVVPGSERSQVVSVINDTGLPVEFEWVWLDSTLPDKYLHREGQKLIARRQEEAANAAVNNNDSTNNKPLLNIDLEQSRNSASLLRSIKANLDMEDSQHPSSANGCVISENSARHENFEIFPARGVLAGEGAAEFKLVYSPLKTHNASLRAVMMIKSIPLVCLPSPDQPRLLQTLESNGHGLFMRWRSWIEELSTSGTVDKYRKPNGSSSTSKGLVSMATIASLLSSYCSQKDELSSEIARVDRWLRLLSRHLYDFRKNDEGAMEDENDDHSVDMETVRQETVQMYDWDIATTDRAVDPLFIPPLTLNYDPPSPPSPPSPSSSSKGGGEYSSTSSDSQDSAIAEPTVILEFSPDEISLLSTLWMDADNVLKLLGEAINDQFNSQVQHEAVEYLKDCALNHFAAVDFKVHGSTTACHLPVSPPCLEIGGSLSLGQAWRGSVTIANNSEAPIELYLKTEELKVKRLFKSSHDDLEDEEEGAMEVEDLEGQSDSYNYNRNTSGKQAMNATATDKKQVKIDVDQLRFLLLPRSTHSVELTITAEALGRFLLTLPLHSQDPQSITVDDIQVMIVTGSPGIRFDCAEVDLGLLGVGAESITTLTFVNEGSVPATFMMKPSLFLENMLPAKKGLPVGTGNTTTNQGQLTNRDTARSQQQIPLSARSGISRQSSIKSDDFSIADSQATSTDFKIELKNAEVTIEPSTGTIQAQQSMTVSIKAKAGKQPQRIRGMVETRVFDVSGLVEAHRQFLNLRGEVQAPKVMLYPMQHSLGQVYVGRPVKFSFTLENICNLPTKFKFVRPGGPSTLFSFALAPLKGSLEAKEKVTITGSLTALAPGLIDDVISCKMFGIKLPLGVSLKALAKGITLEFFPLQPGEKAPLPLAGPDEVQFPHGDKPPEPRPTEPVLLGDAVELYERRVGQFAVRNLSAIAAPFTLKPRKYQVVEKVKRFAATPNPHAATSSSHSSPSLHSSLSLASIQPADRPDLLLAPREDGIHKFQSEAGQAYIGEMVHRREDRRFLQSGLGAAYALDHRTGVIPPWGVIEVQVHAFNDIPGVYDDELEFLLTEGEVTRKFAMPVEMTVHGCPMVILGHSLGMTTVNHTHVDLIKSKPELLGKQLLQLGQALEHSPGQPLVREMIVRNNGSKKSRIKWTVRGLAGKAYGPIKLQLSVLSSSSPRHGSPNKIKTSLRFWEDIAKESPFAVEPRSAILEPYGIKRFTVTLGRSTPASLERASLTADVNVIEDDSKYLSKDGSSNNDDSSSVAASMEEKQTSQSSILMLSSKPSSAKLRSHFSLQLIVEGEIVPPQLILDKHRFVVSHADSTAAESQQLKLSAKATLLFGQGHSSISSDSLCRRLVSMTNPLETAAVVNVSVDGPFLLQEVVDVTAGEVPSSGINPATHSTKKPIDKKKSSGSNSSNTGSVTNVSMMTGKTFHLLPHQSTKFMVSFHPKRHLKESLISSFGTIEGGGGGGGSTGKPTETKGQILFGFPTGQTLHWPATVSISTPFLTGSSPRLYFGICHVRKDCQALYLLSNPTDVPGRWTVSHVTHGGAWKQSTAIRVKGFEQVPEEDDPSVFSLSPDCGLVDGPTVSVAAAMAAPPKDYNNHSVSHGKTAAKTASAAKPSLQDTLNSSNLALMNGEEAERIVPERVVESSWATNTLTLRDAVDLKHNLQHQSEADACYPMPITILFKPKKNVRYCSRFRFSCEFANSFDVVLQGEGTFEEHEHKPLNPVPR